MRRIIVETQSDVHLIASIQAIRNVSEYSFERGVTSELVTSHGLLLIALDGTWLFSSDQIMCPSSQSKQHNNLLSQRDYHDDCETGWQGGGWRLSVCVT